jgi:uncharacterized protein YecT (DUF1311 family)
MTLSLLALPSAVFAQDESPYSAENAGSPQFRQCKSVGTSMVDLGNCLQAEQRRQERLLQLALNENLEGTTAAQRAQILKAQRAWVAFREANCRVRALNGGSGSGIFYSGCMVRETITRRAELSTVWDY